MISRKVIFSLLMMFVLPLLAVAAVMNASAYAEASAPADASAHAAVAAQAPLPEAPDAGHLTVIASNLDNPRHLTFGPAGELFVAEAGQGGPGACLPNPEGGDPVCYGQSGGVSKIMDPASATPIQMVVVDDMPSLASITGTDPGFAAIGPHDVAFDNVGNMYALTGLGADPLARTGELLNLGHLVEIGMSGAWTNTVDVAAYEVSANPDGGLLDSNPYAMKAVDDGFLVVDAGMNALLHVDATGVISTLATFPTRNVPNPFAPGDVPMQSVPTSVAVGPDGAYYVGELTGFPFPVGGANVYRVVPNEAPEVYASGFTNIAAVEFDGDGNLYVLEIAQNGLLSGNFTGALIRVTPWGTQEKLASEGLVAPTGLAIRWDGTGYNAYISNFGVFPSSDVAGPPTGQVVRMAVPPNVIARNLANPRHLTFGPEGALYVAEAGEGGPGACLPNPEGGEPVCYGLTGAVTKINDPASSTPTQMSIVSDLPSIAVITGTNAGMGAGGPHDVAFDDQGEMYALIGLGANPLSRTGQLENLGYLVEVGMNGAWTTTVDVAAYEVSANPDGGLLDSNPFDLAEVDDGFLIVDAGMNALLHMDTFGAISTLAVFPTRMVTNPLMPTTTIPMQSVPTSVAVGPDGAYYVGELTGFPFPVGEARVYRVVPGEAPEIYLTGFTNIIGVDFDAQGNLYVLEMATNSLLSGDSTGALIRVAPDGQRETVAYGLFLPTGLVIEDEGGRAAYVSNYGIFPSSPFPGPPTGQVVRIPLDFTTYMPFVAKDGGN